MTDKQYDRMKQFSEVYGVDKQRLLEALGEEEVRRATLLYLRSYPGRTYVEGLRKLKSRGMLEALENPDGIYERGNHLVVYDVEMRFRFYYRGTPIYEWNAVTDAERVILAGEYEETPSTRNQRKEIRQAISDFREGVWKL